MFKGIKARRAFIDNYRAWKMLHTVDELNLKFYKADLSTGASIIATEYLQKDYDGKIDCNVRYCLVTYEGDSFPNSYYYSFYSPGGCGITTIMEYLKSHPDCEVIDL